jgi:hypothetical protein
MLLKMSYLKSGLLEAAIARIQTSASFWCPGAFFA